MGLVKLYIHHKDPNMRIPGRYKNGAPKYKPPRVYWMCRCDCGELFIARQDNIQNGNTSSCGCVRDEYRQDIVNGPISSKPITINGCEYTSRGEAGRKLGLTRQSINHIKRRQEMVVN